MQRVAIDAPVFFGNFVINVGHANQTASEIKRLLDRAGQSAAKLS